MPTLRDRRDRCPGALRPWPAQDGLLVRLRLIGGQVAAAQLRALADVASRYGDDRVHVTSRANLQIRALPGSDGHLAPEVLAAIEATGLLPTRRHELIRNVMISPQTGLAGGRADLRPVGRALDELLRSSDRARDLPGRFLFVLDDGRGDLRRRSCDLGLVVLDADTAQLRVGTGWGPTVHLSAAARQLAELADRFLDLRGVGPTAEWHVTELAGPLLPAAPPHPRLPEPQPPLPFGDVPGGRHVEVPAAGLDPDAVWALTADIDRLVVTPWRGVLRPEGTR